ncbi:MAG: SOS response-associated peptidase [Acidobacteria bacterium]|nr:SOS response-associated peptidase [Acidobacteriota bacterium]
MCGRYTLSRTQEIFERFQIAPEDTNLPARYNIWPEETLPVVVRRKRNKLEFMRWGLVPPWAEEPRSLAINARIEEILSKPSFHKAVCQQRCLVPASGFFEWEKKSGGKTPYHFRRKDGGLFAFAGIYDTWKSPNGAEKKTFAILTTAPNQLVCEIHNRMPLILTPEQESVWLATEPAETESLLLNVRPLPEQEMECYPVSREVNRAENDSPELIKRVSDTHPGLLWNE